MARLTCGMPIACDWWEFMPRERSIWPSTAVVGNTLHPLNPALQPAATQATLKGWGHILKIQISKVNIVFRGTQQGKEFSSIIIASQAVEYLFISKVTSLLFCHFASLSEHRFLSFVVRYKEDERGCASESKEKEEKEEEDSSVFKWSCYSLDLICLSKAHVLSAWFHREC